MTYSEKLRDPRWQRKRLQRLDAENWTCQRCGATTVTFHIHHRYYVTGRNPWNYPDFCLEVICADCHDLEHAPLADDEEEGIEVWEMAMDSLMRGEPDDSLLWDTFVMAEHLREKKVSVPLVTLGCLVDSWIHIYPDEPLPIQSSPWLNQIMGARVKA